MSQDSKAGSELTLHTFFNSSAAYRVRIAMGLKKLDWKHVGVNIRTGIQRGPDYLAVNPTGLVPTLEHDGTRLTQSLAIIDYLDRLQPEPLLVPKDAGRDRVLEISLLIACDIHPVNNLRILKYLTGKLGVSEELKNEWMAHWIADGFDAIEALLPDSEGWCVGDTPTLADCCLVPQVFNAQRMPGFDLSKYPRIERINAFCKRHPAFAAAAPGVQPDFVSP
ncbi:maleylacetoacetate isomerase [soil metagenome]